MNQAKHHVDSLVSRIKFREGNEIYLSFPPLNGGVTGLTWLRFFGPSIFLPFSFATKKYDKLKDKIKNENRLESFSFYFSFFYVNIFLSFLQRINERATNQKKIIREIKTCQI